MGNLKCGISKKRLIVDQNGRKFLGLGVLQCIYVGYFLCPIVRVWFLVIQCTLKNFQIYNFLKILLLSQFLSDSSKLYTRYHNLGLI